ncbi:MAG TPA: hypothetical protein VK901_02160 [Nitrospiraceae bacterium]|nr:hypothetical protein [Nitrospiraceae bacterium]
MPRLTLLFFGAAKDVPEAAKMVTAGTAAYITNNFERAGKQPKRGPPSSHAAASEKMYHQRNHRYYEQKVNQPPGNVEGGKAQQPHHKQYEKQS